MASLIMHICISNMVKEELGLSDKFLAGSVIPDLNKKIGIDKNITHYLKFQVDDNGNVKQLPDLEKFVNNNTFKLLDFKTLGIYAHLIEDKIWFDKYIGKYIKWHDDDLNIITNLKTGKEYEYSEFAHEIYSDYTVVNSIILDKYNLNLDDLKEKITENLPTDELKLLLNKELSTKYEADSKRYFFTDEDAKNYISDCTKEVIKRINELR